MSSNVIITIARQYGSGGREIGQKVAQKLGIGFYDKELITIAAQKSGINIAVLDHADEHATNSLLYTLAMGSSMYGNSATMSYDIPISDRLFIVQSDIIKNLADENDCVIVGRCADYVLREYKYHFGVFIYAGMESRIQRIRERHNLEEPEAKDLINKTDKRRINYYNFYTGRKWGKQENYQLSVDSSFLGEERTADLIADCAKMLIDKRNAEK